MESKPLTAEQAEGLLAEYEALVEELADLKTEMEVRRLASRAKWDEERARIIAQDAVIRDLRAQLAEAVEMRKGAEYSEGCIMADNHELERLLAEARGIARRLAASLGKEHSTDPDCEDCVALAAFDALHWPEPKEEK